MKNQISKRASNAIKARIRAIEEKYGWEAFRAIASRLLIKRREESKLQREIRAKEQELARLKKKKPTV